MILDTNGLSAFFDGEAGAVSRLSKVDAVPLRALRGRNNMINTAIAHYQITTKLGQGGMGEVYRATDTKLGREVAINDLPTEPGHRVRRIVRQVLECASPLALSLRASAWQRGESRGTDTLAPQQSGRGRPHSKTLPRNIHFQEASSTTKSTESTK